MRKLTKINCHSCNKEIERSQREIDRSYGRSFCSRSCVAVWQFSGSNHPRWKGCGKSTMVCKQCASEFIVERNMQIKGLRQFCSTKCSIKNKADNAPKVTISCKQCSNPFTVNANSHALRRIFCCLKCRSAFYDRSGPKNHNWKGGISSARDVIKSTAEYKAWRLSTYKRDHFKCVVCLCGPTELNTIEAHHLKRFSDYPELILDADNGCTLCSKCHKQTYGCERLVEGFLRSRILRDFTSDTRTSMDLVKIKSGLHGDMQRSAEMTDPAYLAVSA